MEHILNPNYSEIYNEKVLKWLSEEFVRINGEVYVDHAGATLYGNSQIKKITNDLASSLYANPHSPAGNSTSEIVERTRYRILDLFNASSEEYSLIFTSGATASLKCIAESFQFLGSGHFVYLENNHTSVLGMRDVVEKNGAKVKPLSFNDAFEIFENDGNIPLVTEETNNSLFVYPAQCNFTGLKYPLKWIQGTHNGILNSAISGKSKWFVLLDAAGFVGTSPLDLSIYKPDFVALSFYKMFGYPTGIGALIVKNSSAPFMEKVYYGGGTVSMALSSRNYHVKRECLHERFEDGTTSFLSIIALQHGLDTLSKIPLSQISTHVFRLAQFLHHSLSTLHHSNGNPVTEIYSDTDYEDVKIQGGTVAFNILRSNGQYVGYMEVLHMAALFKIHLRTGCFCNPGACQRHLKLSNQDILENFDAGYKCGGSKDLVNGRPTGAIRISFGYMSSIKDVETLMLMIRKCFLDGTEVIKLPRNYKNKIISVNKRNNNSGIHDNNKINEMKNGNSLLKKNEVNLTENENSLKKVRINGMNEDDSSKTNNDTKQDNKTMKINGNEQKTRVVNGNNTSKPLTLSKLYIYPIKSCAAFEIHDSWNLTTKGLMYDREWMIINSSGTCVTQKQTVNMCLIRPTLFPAKNVMRLDYPGMPSVEVLLDYTDEKIIEGEMCRSRVCGHRVEGIDCGTEVSEWLSLALGKPNLKLIRQSSRGLGGNAELSFSSQAQYLLVNRASVEWLVERIPEDSDCDKETVIDRFRGNMVVDGGVAFEEERWTRVYIGDVAFEVMGPCTRCQMVCINQKTGKKTVEPLRLLAEEFQGKLKFGIYLRGKGSKLGKIQIGDRIHCM